MKQISEQQRRQGECVDVVRDRLRLHQLQQAPDWFCQVMIWYQLAGLQGLCGQIPAPGTETHTSVAAVRLSGENKSWFVEWCHWNQTASQFTSFNPLLFTLVTSWNVHCSPTKSNSKEIEYVKSYLMVCSYIYQSKFTKIGDKLSVFSAK